MTADIARPGLPPSADVVDLARHRALAAASRVRILGLIHRAADGMTAAQIATATGLHPSTVRAHLDQLAASGLLSRRRRDERGPGRPAWLYRIAGAPGPATAAAAPTAAPAGFAPLASRPTAPYQDLAAALIAQLARDAEDPHGTGVRAGRDWGRASAAALVAAGGGGGGRIPPVDGLVRILDGMGFSPRVVPGGQPGAAVVHLSSCPFLDLALTSPDVVCGVHRGVISGALGALGAAVADAELEPFAVAGGCVVRVRAGGAVVSQTSEPQITEGLGAGRAER